MAHIRKRRTRYSLVFDIVDKEKGLQKRTPARTMKEAQEYLKEYEWQKATHKPISLLLVDITFNQLAKEYLEYAKIRKTPLTFDRDTSVIKYLCQDIGSLRLGQIDTTEIEKLQAKWKREGNGKGIPNSNKTINQKSILLGTMLNYAIEKKYLIDLPKIPKFKVDKKPPIWYTEEEMELILSNADPFLKNYILVLLYTGMRAGELRNLKWGHVDFDNHIILVEVSKSHTYRKLPIAVPLMTLLKELYNQKTKGQVYVFEYFTAKSVNDFYHKFKRLLATLGIDGHVHKLRHTCATYLANTPGVNLYDVKELLGHASIETTQRYAHIRRESLVNSINKLPDFITGKNSEEKLGGTIGGFSQNSTLKLA